MSTPMLTPKIVVGFLIIDFCVQSTLMAKILTHYPVAQEILCQLQAVLPGIGGVVVLVDRGRHPAYQRSHISNTIKL